MIYVLLQSTMPSVCPFSLLYTRQYCIQIYFSPCVIFALLDLQTVSPVLNSPRSSCVNNDKEGERGEIKMGQVFPCIQYLLNFFFRPFNHHCQWVNLRPGELVSNHIPLNTNLSEFKTRRNLLQVKNSPYIQYVQCLFTYTSSTVWSLSTVYYVLSSFLFFRSFPDHLIHTYHLKGVETAFKKHVEKADSKGVKAHFRMDEDGILHLDRVRQRYEICF